MTTTKNITMERDALDNLQNLVWTAGHVITAISGTQGIEDIEQTLLRPMAGDDDPLKTITAYAIIVRAKSGVNIYKLARILSNKIVTAQDKHLFEYDRSWKANCFADYLYYNAGGTIGSKHGGVGTDHHGREIIRIKITVR